MEGVDLILSAGKTSDLERGNEGDGESLQGLKVSRLGDGDDIGKKENYGEKARVFWRGMNEINRSVSAGAAASFHQELYGAEEVEFSEEEWEDLAEEWSTALVGLFFGTRPSIGKVTGYVRARWGDEKMVSVAQFDLGIFIFTFKSVTDRDRILDQGPWTFDNRPIVLKNWSPDEVYSLDTVSSLPVWVRFPKLGAHLRRIDALSIIASAVGKPIRTDGFTNGKTKLMYARMLVEVYASRELKHSISIKGPRGVTFVQKVEYDWLPPRCSYCQSFGHSDKDCKWPRIEIDVEEDDEDRVVLAPLKAKEKEDVGSGSGNEVRMQEKEVNGSSLNSVVPETQNLEDIEDCNEEVSSREVTCGNTRDVQVEEELVAEQLFIEVKKKGKGKGMKSKKKKVISSQDSDMNIKLKNLAPRSKGKREVK